MPTHMNVPHLLGELDNTAKQHIKQALNQSLSHISHCLTHTVFTACYDSMRKDSHYNTLHSEIAMRHIYHALLRIRFEVTQTISWFGAIKSIDTQQTTALYPSSDHINWYTVCQAHKQYIASPAFKTKCNAIWVQEMRHILLQQQQSYPAKKRAVLANYFLADQMNAILEGVAFYCDTALTYQHITQAQARKIQGFIDLMTLLQASLKASLSFTFNKQDYAYQTWKACIQQNTQKQLIFPAKQAISSRAYSTLQQQLRNDGFNVTLCDALKHHFNEEALQVIQAITHYHTIKNTHHFQYVDIVTSRYNQSVHTPIFIKDTLPTNNQPKSLLHRGLDTLSDLPGLRTVKNTPLRATQPNQHLAKTPLLNAHITQFLHQQHQLITTSKHIVTAATFSGIALIGFSMTIAVLETMAFYYAHLSILNTGLLTSNITASVIYGTAVGLFCVGIMALCIRLLKPYIKHTYFTKQGHSSHYTQCKKLFNQTAYAYHFHHTTANPQQHIPLKINTDLPINNTDNTAIPLNQSPIHFNMQHSNNKIDHLESKKFKNTPPPSFQKFNSEKQHGNTSLSRSRYSYQYSNKLTPFTLHNQQKQRLTYSKSDIGIQHNDSLNQPQVRQNFIKRQKLNHEKSINLNHYQRSNAKVDPRSGLVTNFSSGSSNDTKNESPIGQQYHSNSSTGTVNIRNESKNIHINPDYPPTTEDSPETEDSHGMVYTSLYNTKTG